MILQTDQWESWLTDNYMDPVSGYMRGFSLYLWIFAIASMYFIGIVFILRSRKEGIFASQSWIFRSFGLFFFIMGITRIIFIFAYWIEPSYHLLLTIGYVFGALSLVPLIIVIEKYLILWSHHFFSIVGGILSILSFYFLFFPSQSDFSRTIQEVGMPVLLAGYVILYINVIKLSAGAIRRKAIMTLFGMVVLVVGILLDSERALESWALDPIMRIVGLYIPPLVFALGVYIIGFSQKMD
jgi:hypothetical protein